MNPDQNIVPNAAGQWPRQRGGGEHLVNEQWKPIVNWPAYEISNLGKVRRSGRRISVFLAGGYPAFNVCNGSRRRSLRVHREMALAFLGNQPGMLVRHLDGNPQHCTLSNLAWGDFKDNERDKRYHGTDLSGEHHHSHKLSSSQVLTIRQSNAKRSELAKAYGVVYRTIYAIQKGESWRHL